MRVNKTRKPARSIRYLLSADAKLRKLSLKKIAERATKAKPAARSSRRTGSSPGKKVTKVSWAPGSWILVVGAISIAAATLLTARQPMQRPDAAGMDAEPGTSAPLETPTTAAPGERKALPLVERKAAPPTKVPVSAVAAKPRPADVPVRAVRVPASAAAVESTAASDDRGEAPVTITGCLEFDRGTLSLKEVSGDDAPKSRSWRSGFLKKRPSAIQLVDPPQMLRLRDHVGQRMAVTGTLVKREMRPQSARRLAPSCN